MTTHHVTSLPVTADPEEVMTVRHSVVTLVGVTSAVPSGPN